MFKFTQLINKRTGDKYSIHNTAIISKVDNKDKVHWFLGSIELFPTLDIVRVSHA